MQQVNNGWVYSINTTYANTLQNVITAFHNLGVDLTFVTPSAGSPDCTTVASAMIASSPTSSSTQSTKELQDQFLATPEGSAALESVNAVKDHYNQFLLAQEGVLAAGVGFSEKGTRELVIKVFVRSDAGTDALRKLPKVLNGVTVEAAPAPPTIIAL